jgi:phosphatidylglycerophosphatase A
MTNETDRSPADQEPPSASALSSSTPAAIKRKPRFAIFVATAAGLGYLPKAPGTWGAIAGAAIYVVFGYILRRQDVTVLNILNLQGGITFWTIGWLLPGRAEFLAGLTIAAIGVWASGRVSRQLAEKDPPYVVIDEVSGQQLTYLLTFVGGNWKSLLLGFILFRIFDIWKPFPVRQAESLPGGWGIMADDWLAAVYAALATWIIRFVGQWLAHSSGTAAPF